MAEQLFGLGSSDVPRVKRVLDASEAGQLNTPDTPGRRPFQSPVPFEFGYLTTVNMGSSGYLPFDDANLFLHTTTGQVTTSTGAIVSAKNLTADRIIPGSGSGGLGEMHVEIHRHMRSGNLYYQRIGTQRRLETGPAKTITATTGDYIPVSETTTQRAVNTTGFTFTKQGVTTNFDEITVATPGLYRIDWSVNVQPVNTSGVDRLITIGPVKGSGDDPFSQNFRTNLITESTASVGACAGSYLPREIQLQGFGFGETSTENTPIRLKFLAMSLSCGSRNVLIFNTRILLSGTVYV